jgi:hypothetical protein
LKVVRKVLLALIGTLILGSCEQLRNRAKDGAVVEQHPRPLASPRVPPSAPASIVPDAAPGEAEFPVPPLLDDTKGKQAVLDYREFLKEICTTPVSSGKKVQRLAAAGFPAGSDVSVVCLQTAQYQRPLASGSLLEANADEFLLEVPSGRTAGSEQATLAVMRRAEGGYRLLRHVSSAGRYEAKLRVLVPGHPDALLLCTHAGSQGRYRATCGFFGSGSFAADGPRPSRDEIELLDMMTCGAGGAVRLGEVTSQGRRILVALIVEEYHREREAADSDQPVFICGKKTSRRLDRFVIEYVLDDAGRYRRVTPIPRRVTETLGR